MSHSPYVTCLQHLFLSKQKYTQVSHFAFLLLPAFLLLLYLGSTLETGTQGLLSMNYLSALYKEVEQQYGLTVGFKMLVAIGET